jgi:glutathione S-transferase
MGSVSFAGSTLYGWLVSPYTAKVRSMLVHKGIQFRDCEPSAAQMYLKVKPAVGRVIMPTMQLADGSWRQDSALICDEIEACHPERPTQPPGAAQRLASSLLELHGDEWLPMLALYFRWAYGADAEGGTNAEWAVAEFGRCAFPWAPSAIATHLAQPFASAMKAHRKTQGIAPDGQEKFARSLIRQLDVHLAEHPFLLGGAPCRGDFSLYGTLWAHLYRDPHSRPLYDDAPHVVRWFERLHGHHADPAFPGLAARADRATGQFLASDQVPLTLDPIFSTLFAEQWPFLTRLAGEIDALAREGAPSTRAPRAFGYAPFVVGGQPGERRLVTYQAWRLQRPLELYSALALAPSRELERRSAEAWLERIGAAEVFHALQPATKLERDSSLPCKQEAFTMHPRACAQ